MAMSKRVVIAVVFVNVSLILLLALFVVAPSWPSGKRIQRTQGERNGIQPAAITLTPQHSRFSVSAVQADARCTKGVISTAASALGSEDASSDFVQLAEMLAAEEADASELLKALGVGGANGKERFSLQTFCNAVLRHIPEFLGEAVPLRHDMGCLSKSCHEAVDISEDTLAQEGLTSPLREFHEPPQSLGILSPTSEQTNTTLEPEAEGKRLFRLATNVVFGFFPSPDEIDDEVQSPPLQAVATAPNVIFGSDVSPRRHEAYRSYTVKASAWVAQAIRKVRNGRALIAKWFHIKSESQMDAQIRRTRRHLTKMLGLMSNLHIKRGSSYICRHNGNAGVLAYVKKWRWCGVDSSRDCGEKESGRHIVNICDVYWSFGFGSDARTGTIVHESSHHFGTEDVAYCEGYHGYHNCLNLLPKYALANADSYTYFIKELIKDYRIKDDMDSIPHEECNTLCGQSSFQGRALTKEFRSNSCGKCEVKPGFRVIPRCGYTRGVPDKGVPQEEFASSLTGRVCCQQFECEVPKRKKSKSRSLWWELLFPNHIIVL